MKLSRLQDRNTRKSGSVHHSFMSLIVKSSEIIFVVIALTVFFSEALIMLVIHYLPKESFRKDAFTDAMLLVIMTSPALYFFLFRPMAIHINARQRSENRFRTLASSAFEGVAITERDRLVYVNDQLVRMLGYERHGLIGRDLTDLVPIQDRDRVMTSFRNGADSHIEHEMLCKDGSRIIVEAHWQTLEKEGLPVNLVTIRDITEKKKVDEIIARHASFDALTGLSNRRLFSDLLAQEIRRCHRSHHSLALMFIDLDRFKDVNDKLGHPVGDKLLMAAAKRIVACVRESDVVSRLGGDEFTVILTEVTSVDHIESVADAIIRSLSQPYGLGEEGLFLSASIGISIYPNDATNPDDLLRSADQAMYMSKREGRNCFHFFTEAMQESIRKRHQLAEDLYGAFRGRQFQIYFQPIVNLGTGAVYKAEALLRWRHPVRGMISPEEFIPVAEDVGIIDEISNWVFQESLKHGNRWSRLVHQPFRISVNISPVQFRTRGNAWIKHIQEMKANGPAVSIEITEGTLLDDHPEVINLLHAIHESGMEVAIDDFGTGYSSLSYLQKFKIDYVKIDRSIFT